MTGPAGPRVVVSPLRGDEYYIAAFGGSAARGSENRKTGLAPVGNAPLSPPAAVLPPMGEVCSTLTLGFIRYE